MHLRLPNAPVVLLQEETGSLEDYIVMGRLRENYNYGTAMHYYEHRKFRHMH